MEIIRKVLAYKNLKIEYYIHYKKVKNIILKIGEKGEIIIVCNNYVPLSKIESFLSEEIEKVLIKQQEINKNRIIYYEDINKQNIFTLYGKKLKVIKVLSNQNSVRYDDENFYVYYKKEEDLHKTVLNFIDKKCETDFKEVLDFYYHKMIDYKFEYPQIKYRTMTSRWGSCIPKKAVVTFNKRLLHTPYEFMEYVILHELAHFVEPNHGKHFYQVIETFMPDYKNRIKLLKHQ